jgi:hypothetical protein
MTSEGQQRFDKQQIAHQDAIARKIRNAANTHRDTFTLTGADIMASATAFNVTIPDQTLEVFSLGYETHLKSSRFRRITKEGLESFVHEHIDFVENGLPQFAEEGARKVMEVSHWLRK